VRFPYPGKREMIIAEKKSKKENSE